jgi:hypothetical protein
VAISLASAIDGIAGVSASAATNDVRIVPDAGTYSLTIAKTAADAGMTATSGTDGLVHTSGKVDSLWIVGGTSAAPSLRLGGDGGVGLWFNDSDNTLRHSAYGDSLTLWRQMEFGLASGSRITWSSDANFNTGNFVNRALGLEYGGAALLKVTDGSTGSGNIEASTAITAVGTAAYNGVIRTGVYKRAWTNAEVAGLSGKDAELKVATLPAKTVVRNAYVIVNTNESYLSDLTVALGRTGALYVDYIVASNAKAETLGGELVTNGTFTGNATGWTLGAGGGTPDWYYDNNNVSHASDSATGTLTPTTPLVAVVGTQYKLTWTMAHTSGTGVTASFGGVSGTQRASSATFDEYFTATSTATLTFTPTANWVGSVDTVILKEVARTVYGAASGERGVNLTGYDLPSYTAVTDVYLNFVTTDGTYNLANALQSTGAVYLMTEVLP